MLTLAMVTEEDTMIYHQSLLILGTLAKQLRYQEPDLYTEIVSILHSLLEQHAGNIIIYAFMVYIPIINV